MASASCSSGDLVGGDLADDAHAEARARERLAPDDLLGQAELLADPADLVLEQVAERLDELEVHVFGEAADVVVRLDGGRLGAAAGLDDVGVERALDQEVGVGDAALGILEDADEQLADGLALRLGLGDAGQLLEEPVGGPHVDELDAEVALERLDDLVALVLAHEAGVDEHAGELVADGLVHERGGHGGVDPAGETADGPARRRPAPGPRRPRSR